MFRKGVVVPKLFRQKGGPTQQWKDFGYMLLLRFIYFFTTYNNADSYSESMIRGMVLPFLGGTASNHEKPVK